MELQLLGLRMRKIRHILAHPRIWMPVLRARAAPSVELAGLLFDVRPSTVIDIGANAGQFTLFAVTDLGARRVIAIEPSAGPAERYDRAFAHDPRVELHRVAVGTAKGRATLHVSASADSSSLLSITDRQVAVFPGTHEVRTEEVEVRPLSNVVGVENLFRPVLVKIDVQGAELDALQSAEGLLDRCRWVLVEASFEVLYEGQPLADDVVRWMMERGWSLSRVATTHRLAHLPPVQADFLFTRKNGTPH